MQCGEIISITNESINIAFKLLSELARDELMRGPIESNRQENLQLQGLAVEIQLKKYLHENGIVFTDHPSQFAGYDFSIDIAGISYHCDIKCSIKNSATHTIGKDGYLDAEQALKTGKDTIFFSCTLPANSTTFVFNGVYSYKKLCEDRLLRPSKHTPGTKYFYLNEKVCAATSNQFLPYIFLKSRYESSSSCY